MLAEIIKTATSLYVGSQVSGPMLLDGWFDDRGRPYRQALADFLFTATGSREGAEILATFAPVLVFGLAIRVSIHALTKLLKEGAHWTQSDEELQERILREGDQMNYDGVPNPPTGRDVGAHAGDRTKAKGLEGDELRHQNKGAFKRPGSPWGNKPYANIPPHFHPENHPDLHAAVPKRRK